MKITVCELHDDLPSLEEDWEALVKHVKKKKSDLVLLPEMAFYPWLAVTDKVETAEWHKAVNAHQGWLARLYQLSPAVVLGTFPIFEEDTPYNEAFVWTGESGLIPTHRKVYLPDEPGFWEATWYRRGEKTFEGIATDAGKVGFMVCTEMWFTEHAREYARQKVQIIATPRATELSSADKWIAGGRATAVMGGAFCISSNRTGNHKGIDWGGHGWVIDPNGEVLGVTSKEEPCLTIKVDLKKADKAKKTYPRYVSE
jgi:N-carbamoylputrescine amidase